MRYGALDVYSGLLQAIGLIICCGSIGVAVAVGIDLSRSMKPTDALMTYALLAGAAFFGCLIGLLYAAIGQVFAVLMDIEHNTRHAIPRPALEASYAND